jgi:hypothetical protein
MGGGDFQKGEGGGDFQKGEGGGDFQKGESRRTPSEILTELKKYLLSGGNTNHITGPLIQELYSHCDGPNRSPVNISDPYSRKDWEDALALHEMWLNGDRGGRRFVGSLRMSQKTRPGRTGAFVDLHGADLRAADLVESQLYHLNLEGANLQGANLSGSSLEYCNLKDAILCDIEVYGGFSMRFVDLQGADLREVNWGRARSILNPVNLESADLRGNYFPHKLELCAVLTNVKFSKFTRTDMMATAANLGDIERPRRLLKRGSITYEEYRLWEYTDDQKIWLDRNTTHIHIIPHDEPRLIKGNGWVCNPERVTEIIQPHN